jgi:hypothetical protein
MSRSVSATYIVAGVVFIVALVALAMYSENRGELSGTRGAILLPDRSSDFIIANSLPKARQHEARSLYESAQRLADGHALEAARANRWNHYLQWAAFFLSSLIVVLAGYYGRTSSDETAEGLIKDLQAASLPPEPRKPRFGRFASLVGLIAALSAVSNGAATRLQASAVQSRQAEQVVSDAVVKTSKVTAQPTSEADVDAALEELRGVIRDNPL